VSDTKYQEDNQHLPDSEYMPGDIRYIAAGNKGRYLDNRRTQGLIESVNEKKAVFYWRVGAFEDKDTIWELDFEEIENFQFETGASVISKYKIAQYEKEKKKYNHKIIINNNVNDLLKSNHAIKMEISNIKERGFLGALAEMEIEKLNSNKAIIQESLYSYLLENKLNNLDEKITGMIVSNPYSGEILKHLWFRLAKLGFVRYENRVPKLLEGIPEGKDIEAYIIKRIAFVRALFEISGVLEITTYRGVNSPYKWLSFPKAFSSWTLDYSVANDLAKINDDTNIEVAYIMKRRTRTTEIFLTSIETKAMNRAYDEKEVLLFANPENGIY
jgi:hypothetical protein